MIGVLRLIFSLLLHDTGHGHGNAHYEHGHGAKHEEQVLDKYKRLHSHAKLLVDTANVTHTEAYLKAVNTHLRNDKGEVQFDKLDKESVQREFKKTMSDFYVQKAKDYFKSAKGDLNEFEKDMMMQAYIGVTDSALEDMIYNQGKKLTPTAFEELKQRTLQRQFEQRMYGVAGGHLSNEHIEDIVAHVGIKDKVKDKMLSLQEALQLLQVHTQEGEVTDSNLRQIVGAYKMKHKDDNDAHGGGHGGHDAHGGGHEAQASHDAHGGGHH